MPKESIAMRYLRLSKELGEKYDEEVKRLTKGIIGELNKALEKELNAMETALQSGDIAKASFHKMKAEILFGSLLP